MKKFKPFGPSSICRCIVVLVGLLLTACNEGGSSGDGGNLAGSSSIHILSNRADLISGGDALVKIDLAAPNSNVSDISVQLNGSDVTDKFQLSDEGQLMGRIENLELGENLVVAIVNGVESQVTINNHPNEGPVFSRAEIKRFRCQDGAEDINCNQAPEYTFLYRPVGPLNSLEPYDVENPPFNVANTTTQTGDTVPFIVRQERGYQDKDEYKILTLFTPGEEWEPWSPQSQWNGKLLIPHGGSCGASYEPGVAPLFDFSGTADIPVVSSLIDQSYIYALGKGFAVLSTALNNGGHNCDVVLQAESMMMAKERFVEQYGPIRYTIGTGCSGGAIAQLTVANSYPGIYQGLITFCSYPDTLTAGLQFADYHLLRGYFENPLKWGLGVIWLPGQLGAVEGHIGHLNAVAADEGLFKKATRVTGDCFGDDTYHPETNPDGQRCGMIEWMPHVFGTRTQETWSELEEQLGYGFTGLPLGNNGVQYGLKALQQGKIFPAQFVDLNVKVGGLDVDIQRQPERTVANTPAVPNAYRSGVVNMTNNLNTVPIITAVGPDPGFAHDAVHSWWIRWRMEREHGAAHNHVMWGGPLPLVADFGFTLKAIDEMDRWLEAVEGDLSDTPLPQKITFNRPEHIKDQCSLGTGDLIFGEACIDFLRPFYAYSTPREVAGDVRTADTLDCDLKPFSRADNYGPFPFTEVQWQQLETLFIDGVCDFRKPGKGKQKTIPWLNYVDDSGRVIIGGEPMPPAPANSGTGMYGEAFNYSEASGEEI